MITTLTFQDFLSAENRENFVKKAIDEYKSSPAFNRITEMEKYYMGGNPTLMSYFSKVKIENQQIDVFAKIRVPSSIFNRIVLLQVNRLWYNGVQLDDVEKKRRLGKYFDKTAKDIATNAAVHGVCYGFWNYDGLEMLTAKNYFPLTDEKTGAHMAGISFWQVAEEKPLQIRLFELDGYTKYTRNGNGSVAVTEPKRAYKLSTKSDALETVVVGDNYPGFPVLPMYANTRHESELSTPIKSKIDLYDAILTTFGDSVLRTRAIYWVLEGMSGNIEHLTELRNTIERLGIIAPNGEATAKAETIELPYSATMKFLEELEKAIFRDAVVTNPQEIMGGNLTATAVNASYHAEKLKVSDMEWNAADFIDRLLALIGVKNDSITFKHETISADAEITQRLALYSELDLETKLTIDPLFAPEMVPDILKRVEMEALAMDGNKLETGDQVDGDESNEV